MSQAIMTLQLSKETMESLQRLKTSFDHLREDIEKCKNPPKRIELSPFAKMMITEQLIHRASEEYWLRRRMPWAFC